jgi:hypothetical protein
MFESAGLSGDRRWIAVKLSLMEIRVGEGSGAGGIQLGYLFLGQIPAHRTQVLAKLFLIACANDHAGDSRALEQPVILSRIRICEIRRTGN